MKKRANREEIQQAFMENVKVVPSACWEWQGVRMPRSGYGQFKVSLWKERIAHRVSYRLFVGDIPDGLFILHKCNNTSCVNPLHLYAGTQKENIRDVIQSGHHKPFSGKGESNPNATLTEESVREIRRLYASRDVTQKHLAKQFGVSKSMIHCICTGQNWKHIA